LHPGTSIKHLKLINCYLCYPDDEDPVNDVMTKEDQLQQITEAMASSTTLQHLMLDSMRDAEVAIAMLAGCQRNTNVDEISCSELYSDNIIDPSHTVICQALHSKILQSTTLQKLKLFISHWNVTHFSFIYEAMICPARQSRICVLTLCDCKFCFKI
jgi:hypothetical protein